MLLGRRLRPALLFGGRLVGRWLRLLWLLDSVRLAMLGRPVGRRLRGGRLPGGRLLGGRLLGGLVRSGMRVRAR
ncbi:MAG: hypothetical protein ACRDYV_19340, partial [Acidimicrobiia bacterium]